MKNRISSVSQGNTKLPFTVRWVGIRIKSMPTSSSVKQWNLYKRTFGLNWHGRVMYLYLFSYIRLHLVHSSLWTSPYFEFIKKERHNDDLCVHLYVSLLINWQYIIKINCLFFGARAPQWARDSSFTRFLDHTRRRTTVGKTPLDEWSARRRDLYLTTHSSKSRKTSMPQVGFEPTISGGERPQIYALDRAATGTGLKLI